MTNVLILLAAVAVALAAGFLIRARSGKVLQGKAPDAQAPDSPAPHSPAPHSPAPHSPAPHSAELQLLRAAGLSQSGPTILHFSATWCGPCAAVRRVVGQVVEKSTAEGLTVLDLELDIDENPALAKQLKVLSLPTTFIYDASAAQLHRIPGVPKADALLAALRPLS